jgi:Putative salt-induced outer membrane protein
MIVRVSTALPGVALPSALAIAALGVALGAASPAAAALPEPVRAMIAKAAESRDPAVLSAVVAVARQTHPDEAADIDRLAAELAHAEAAPETAPETAPAAEPAEPALELATAAAAATPANANAALDAPVWKGSLEFGGSLVQGSTESVGAYGVVDVSRVTPLWTQRLTWRGDYQETNGRASTQRLSLAYEPRVRLSSRRYTYGLAQYEHDRFLGVEHRYTVGAGLGVQLANAPDLKIAVDLGPALRLTETQEYGEERAAAGRASLNVRWLPSDRITLSQEAALYAEADQTSAKSITAVETLLFGPLKARLSYNMQYERDSRVARSDLDTTTRASVLYTF